VSAGAPVNARSIAARVLVRVLDDRAFASAALDVEIDRHPQLDRRDVGLATELVYGTLRTWSFLETLIAERSRRSVPPESIVRAHLLIY
jgi:16S rRNA (cytosine967-C5)-methyltransferase